MRKLTEKFVKEKEEIKIFMNISYFWLFGVINICWTVKYSLITSEQIDIVIDNSIQVFDFDWSKRWDSFLFIRKDDYNWS
jgi:hypothetical protein